MGVKVYRKNQLDHARVASSKNLSYQTPKATRSAKTVAKASPQQSISQCSRVQEKKKAAERQLWLHGARKSRKQFRKSEQIKIQERRRAATSLSERQHHYI